jgi:hypothetical protein
MTAQGHPRAIFKWAVERGNLVVAEATARELGKLSLEEALRLLFLYAEKEPSSSVRPADAWPRAVRRGRNQQGRRRGTSDLSEEGAATEKTQSVGR